MARANQEFFVKFRKEINEDDTPPTTLELLDCGLLCPPGLEPENSLAYSMKKRYPQTSNHRKNLNHAVGCMMDDIANYVEQQDICSKIKNAEIEAVRTLVTEIIAYAEKFPPEQNEKAEVVKEVLYAKSVNGIIPYEVLNDVLRERLNNLGRKEQHYQIKSLVEVSGNDKVILGGLSNG